MVDYSRVSSETLLVSYNLLGFLPCVSLPFNTTLCSIVVVGFLFLFREVHVVDDCSTLSSSINRAQKPPGRASIKQEVQLQTRITTLTCIRIQNLHVTLHPEQDTLQPPSFRKDN